MKRSHKAYTFALFLSLSCFSTGCYADDANYGNSGASATKDAVGGCPRFNASTSVADVVNCDAFRGFGRFLFPTEYGSIDSRMKLNNVGSLLPYHSHIRTETTLEVLNAMVDAANGGSTIFYDIYSAEEKRRDPSKANTGLFFFRGEKNAPFAVVCAGGGFSYVGSIHESFPHALELSKRGYNAFAIQYRTSAQVACQDLAAAISFIFRNADSLQISTKCYSLWGGSAGARMAASLGSHGPAYFGGDNLPRPGTVIMQYTGHSDYVKDEPPTFAVVGEDDGIADWRTMERRISTLKALGVDAEFHKYPNLGHGFGLGIGTSAEGWMEKAIAFWEKQLRRSSL